MQGASLSVTKNSGGIGKGGQDGLPGEVLMGGEQVIERPASAKLIENVLDGYAGARYHRLAHHDLGVANDQILMHRSLGGRAYRGDVVHKA